MSKIGEQQKIILSHALLRDYIGELTPMPRRDISLATKIVSEITSIQHVIDDFHADGWQLLGSDPIGRDSCVFEHADHPDRIKKWYRNLDDREVTVYYEFLDAFGDWLHHKAPSHELQYGRKVTAFSIDPKHISLVKPIDIAPRTAGSVVTLPKVFGEPVVDDRIYSDVDALLGYFVRYRFGEEMYQHLFFPYKKLNHPMMVFGSPNIKQHNDHLTLLDVNRVKHLVRVVQR